MRIFSVVSVVLFAAISTSPASARAHSECRDSLGNSCWSVSNNSDQTVGLNCFNSFQVMGLGLNQVYSHQFDTRLADGLGYGAPHANYNCALTVNGKIEKQFHFSNLFFGDRVQFHVYSNKVTVTVTDIWKSRSKVYEF